MFNEKLFKPISIFTPTKLCKLFRNVYGKISSCTEITFMTFSNFKLDLKAHHAISTANYILYIYVINISSNTSPPLGEGFSVESVRLETHRVSAHRHKRRESNTSRELSRIYYMAHREKTQHPPRWQRTMSSSRHASMCDMLKPTNHRLHPTDPNSSSTYIVHVDSRLSAPFRLKQKSSRSVILFPHSSHFVSGCQHHAAHFSKPIPVVVSRRVFSFRSAFRTSSRPNTQSTPKPTHTHTHIFKPT